MQHNLEPAVGGRLADIANRFVRQILRRGHLQSMRATRGTPSSHHGQQCVKRHF